MYYFCLSPIANCLYIPTVIQPSKKDALESGIPTDLEAALKAKEDAAFKMSMPVEEAFINGGGGEGWGSLG